MKKLLVTFLLLLSVKYIVVPVLLFCMFFAYFLWQSIPQQAILTSGEKADKHVTFDNPDDTNRTVRYCVLIEDNKIRIVSRELDGKSHYPDEDVPHSQSCS
ncbi:MAG TPA: hypothetical protein VFD58_32695 [Blastocatellia bacterium]|nr:hypothetical protein [Blastocatellia bacterium]